MKNESQSFIFEDFLTGEGENSILDRPTPNPNRLLLAI